MVIDQCNSRQCTQFILPTFDNWREWLILLQSTRMVDSDICIDKIGWFYPNRESTFWTMHAILELHIPILAMRNNKMGHRINKMWTLINKVGHRNVKLVDTYQQVGFKKQQNGSRVLYQKIARPGWWTSPPLPPGKLPLREPELTSCETSILSHRAKSSNQIWPQEKGTHCDYSGSQLLERKDCSTLYLDLSSSPRAAFITRGEACISHKSWKVGNWQVGWIIELCNQFINHLLKPFI